MATVTPQPLPGKVTMPGGEKFVCVLLRIQSRYENNIPEDVTLLPSTQACEIHGGEQFITAYIPEKLMEPQP